jgi:N-acyl-D-amino-acid deacylase
VHQLVLQPLGIAPGVARVGRTLPEGRAPGEVHYYDDKNRTGPAVVGKPLGRTVPEPYGAWYLEAMDAHGGWIATAPALVRFASAFDPPARCKVLSVSGIHTMFARPPGPAGAKPNGQPKDAYYGCGWEVRPMGRHGINTWHTGSLPGTASILVRRFDGLTWAVLFNTRDGLNGEFLAGAIDPLVHDAADAVRQWPAEDQFSTTPAE